MNKLPDVLTNAVLACISRPDYHVDPPKLSPTLWDRVCILTPEAKAENERLEFLGDALMDACFGMELYRQVPEGYPHMYTEIRSALHRNLTFCHLANKMGIVRSSGHAKSIGDIFETLMGAYYTEKGFDALYEWTKRTYEPILNAAVEAFYGFHRKQRASVQNDIYASMSSLNIEDLSSSSTSTSPDRNKGKGKVSVSGYSPVESSSPQQAGTSPYSRPEVSRRTPLAGPFQPSVTTPETEPRVRRYPSLFPQDEDESLFDYSDIESPSPHPNLSSSMGKEPNDPPDYYTAHNSVHEPSPPHERVLSSTAPVPQRSILSENEPEDLGPLPEFWEELRMPDGKFVYVDHKNQTTTWDDPRKPKPPPKDGSGETVGAPAAWTARLVAPVPVVPQTSAFSSAARWGTSADPFTHSSRDHTEHYGGTSVPFPDLSQEGYIVVPLDDCSVPDGSLPDFWEVRQGNDGYLYSINHATATIIRQPHTVR